MCVCVCTHVGCLCELCLCGCTDGYEGVSCVCTARISWGHLSTWSCGMKRAHPAPPARRTHGWASMEMGTGQWAVSGEGLRIGEWEPCLSVGSAVVPEWAVDAAGGAATHHMAPGPCRQRASDLAHQVTLLWKKSSSLSLCKWSSTNFRQSHCTDLSSSEEEVQAEINQSACQALGLTGRVWRKTKPEAVDIIHLHHVQGVHKPCEEQASSPHLRQVQGAHRLVTAPPRGS